MFNLCLNIAKNAHKNQKDKGNNDYINHCLYVSDKFKNSNLLRCVAILHDVIEDSTITKQDLLDKNVNKNIVDLVDILTHKKNESYDDYINKINSNYLASLIKIEDLKNNSDISRLNELTDKDEKRLLKYKNALNKLEKFIIDGKEHILTNRIDLRGRIIFVFSPINGLKKDLYLCVDSIETFITHNEYMKLLERDI